MLTDLKSSQHWGFSFFLFSIFCDYFLMLSYIFSTRHIPILNNLCDSDKTHRERNDCRSLSNKVSHPDYDENTFRHDNGSS